MKGLLIFLTVALVAASATPAQYEVDEKSIITDAIALVKCLTENVGTIQGSVIGVIEAVKDFEQLVEDVNDKIEACNALGGENPSITDQIQVAQCLIALGASINQDVTTAINKIVDNVKIVIDSATAIEKCF